MPASTAAHRLAESLRLPTTIGDVLLRRGYEDDDRTRKYLDPRLADLSSPEQMAGRAEAIDRLVFAIQHKQQVVVFGDYDCDGITAVAIMTEVIRSLGGQVEPRLASRFSGGYGFSDQAVDHVLALKPKVVVTCDCGSTDHARLQRLVKEGVDTIVIDHHLVPSEPLPALAFLNPQRPDCPFPYKHLASCGLAMSIGAGLRRKIEPSLDMRQWLDLVAIGTVADVSPMDGDNRMLVRAGLRALERTTRIGLKSLAQQAGLALGHGVTTDMIAFELAPRLNAPGRMADPKLSLDLILCRDPVEARMLAGSVESSRGERRRIQQQILEEAIREIEAKGFDRDPAIVVGREGWHQGVVGIVAAQLAERYGKVSIVIAFEGRTGRGSARVPEGIPVYDLLTGSSNHLLKFGGHQAAAGVELELSKLDLFRDDFNASVASYLGSASPHTSRGAEVLLDDRDRLLDIVHAMGLMEPFGRLNPYPLIAIHDARVVRANETRGGHLQLTLRTSNDSNLHGFGLLMGSEAAALKPDAKVNVEGKLFLDTFRGGGAVGIRFTSPVRL